MLRLGKSYHPDRKGDELFIKMDGHDIYRYALKTVPLVVKQALDKAGLMLGDVNKILMHQANAKMDEAILKRLFKLCGVEPVAEGVMPMIIDWAGNSSVATVPTLLDLLLKEKLNGPAAKLRGCGRLCFRGCGDEHQRHGLPHAVNLTF